MCLVSILGKGTIKDSEEVTKFIKKGASSNVQGSGYMFKKNKSKEIHIIKGFFNVDELLESIKKQKLKKDDELVVHHRISTCGLVSAENSHPFVCSDIEEEVSASEIITDKPCIAHNGMFSGLGKFERKNPDFSDTYAFARYIMGDKNVMNIFNNDQDKFETMFDKIISGSRIAILHPDRDVIMIGNFVEDGGYYHSNSGYKAYTYDRGGSSFGNFGHRSGTWPDSYHVNNSAGNDLLCAINYNKPSTPLSVTDEVNSRLNPDKKGTLRRFDSRNLELSWKNAHHFNFIKKQQYDTYVSHKHLRIYTLYDEFNDVDQMFTLDVLPSDNGTNYFSNVKRSELIEDYYYISKVAYAEIYDDYYMLMTSVMDIGKSTIKKLNELINRNHNKGIDDKLFYKKMGLPICKGALTAYRDWLEEAAKEIYDVPEAESIEDEYIEPDNDDETTMSDRFAVTNFSD